MTEKSNTTMEVIVHKANIPLVSGESIHQFTMALSDAGRKYVLEKLNVITKDGKGGAWNAEIFGNNAVFAVWKDGTPNKYYSVGYQRDKEGNFKFSDIKEVIRVVDFKPKPGLTVTKAKGDVFENTGWEPTQKNMWGNVL